MGRKKPRQIPETCLELGRCRDQYPRFEAFLGAGPKSGRGPICPLLIKKNFWIKRHTDHHDPPLIQVDLMAASVKRSCSSVEWVVQKRIKYEAIIVPANLHFNIFCRMSLIGTSLLPSIGPVSIACITKAVHFSHTVHDCDNLRLEDQP